MERYLQPVAPQRENGLRKVSPQMTGLCQVDAFPAESVRPSCSSRAGRHSFGNPRPTPFLRGPGCCHCSRRRGGTWPPAAVDRHRAAEGTTQRTRRKKFSVTGGIGGVGLGGVGSEKNGRRFQKHGRKRTPFVNMNHHSFVLLLRGFGVQATHSPKAYLSLCIFPFLLQTPDLLNPEKNSVKSMPMRSRRHRQEWTCQATRSQLDLTGSGVFWDILVLVCETLLKIIYLGLSLGACS